MEARWKAVVAAAIVLALPLGGCRHIGHQDSLPVGACVRVSDAGTATVPCSEPHTHKVVAIVPGAGEACPVKTVMYSSPADEHDPLMTTCFQVDGAAD